MTIGRLLREARIGCGLRGDFKGVRRVAARKKGWSQPMKGCACNVTNVLHGEQQEHSSLS